jgi:hypothetical protein
MGLRCSFDTLPQDQASQCDLSKGHKILIVLEVKQALQHLRVRDPSAAAQLERKCPCANNICYIASATDVSELGMVEPPLDHWHRSRTTLEQHCRFKGLTESHLMILPNEESQLLGFGKKSVKKSEP